MTRILSAQGEELINSLALAGDENFEIARFFAENAGFNLIEDGVELSLWCTAKAESGDLDAQHALAEFLYVGLFGMQDKQKSYEWCCKAAKSGHMPSVLMLSGFVEEGFKSPIPDAETGFKLSSFSAERGYVPAVRALGIIYLTGAGVRIDSKKAFKYFESASEAGDAYSQFMLGTTTLNFSDPALVSGAIRWIKKSADQGFPSALAMLANFYADGLYGLKKSKTKSARYALQAKIAESSKRLSP